MNKKEDAEKTEEEPGKNFRKAEQFPISKQNFPTTQVEAEKIN